MESIQQKSKQHEQNLIQLMLAQKEDIRIKVMGKIEKGRKEIMLVGQNEHESLIKGGFDMLKCSFLKILDLYFQKILPNFILFYPESELLKKAKLLQNTYKKSTAIFIKQLKDYLRGCEKLDDHEDSSHQHHEKKHKKFTDRATQILKEYLLNNFEDPYPGNEEKQRLAHETGLTISQVNNWFVNTRERLIKRFYRKESMGLMLKKMCS